MRSSTPPAARSTWRASSGPPWSAATWVVCARFIDSSLAYQGAGYGNDMDELRRLQDFATCGLLPDLTILLDVPVEVGLERTAGAREWNRFEDTEEVAFFERVRQRLPAAGRRRARALPGRRRLGLGDRCRRGHPGRPRGRAP